MKNKFALLLIGGGILIFCLFALLPLFHSGFFTIHDDEQIARMQQMYLVLSQGQIPPRWIPDLGFGFGFPLFDFYPPLVYYIGSLFHFLGFGYIVSTKIVIGLGFFFAAVAMFIWVRKHFGILAGLFAAFLYTYAPYHSVDVYVRGALSEFFSWIWVPLVFWATDLLLEKKDKKSVLLLSLSLALLMLSHSLVMLQLSILYILYIVLLLLFQKKDGIRTILLLCGAGLLALGLTAYFWLPSLLEKQYTLVDAILTKELANYALHFVCPIQLWSSPWGYGGSIGGCVDGLSFQIGKIQILVSVVGILLGIFFVFRKKYLTPFVVSVIFLSSVFLTLSYSHAVWQLLKPFWYIQFPWRYLLFADMGAAFLGGFVIFVVQKKWDFGVALILALLLSSLAIFQVRNYFKPQQYLVKTDADYTSKEDLQWRVSGLSYEYVPNQVATKKSSQNTTELAITHADLSTQPFTVSTGTMSVTVLQNVSYLKKLQVRVYNQGILRINTYAFPGWEVVVNGKRITHFQKNTLDLIAFYLPKGTYTVIVRLVSTPVQNSANSISIVSVLVLLVSIFWRKNHI